MQELKPDYHLHIISRTPRHAELITWRQLQIPESREATSKGVRGY